MATISSIGIGSGLDIESMITQLVAVERAPVTKLQTEATSLQTKLSTYGKLQSGMAALRDAASALTRASTWNATVGVEQRRHVGGRHHQRQHAARQLLASRCSAWPRCSPTPPACTPRPMRWSAKARCTSSWAPGAPGRPASRPRPAPPRWTSRVGPPAESLAQLRDKINASNSGVVASVLTDASGARLVLRSAATGEANGFRVGVTDNDGNNCRRRRPVGAGLRPVGRHPDDGPGAGRGQRRRQPERTADRLGKQHAVERARRHDADAGQGDHRTGAGRGQARQGIDPQGAGQLRHRLQRPEQAGRRTDQVRRGQQDRRRAAGRQRRGVDPLADAQPAGQQQRRLGDVHPAGRGRLRRADATARSSSTRPSSPTAWPTWAR